MEAKERKEFEESNAVLWKQGTVSSPSTGEKYSYQAKVYPEGSEFGIDRGKISILNIRRLGGTTDLCNYSRGWDVEPAAEVREIYEILLAKYN